MSTGTAVALVVAAIVGGSALVSAAEPGTATSASGSERERALAAFDRIREQQADAWYREDSAAFAATFTSDADVVTFNGDHLRTRDGIEEGMRFYFEHYIDHTRLRTVDEHVRFAGPDLAIIVRTGCQLEPPNTECREDSLSRNTNVLVKRHGRWLQQSFQNTRVVELPNPA